MSNETIKITDGVPRKVQFNFQEPLNLTINKGEQIAILGKNGAGKSALAEIIMGKCPLKSGRIRYSFDNPESDKVSDNIKLMVFRDSYGGSYDRDYYYQQRWNSCDREGQPKVGDILAYDKENELQVALFEMFDIEKMLNREVIMLSSGELRKFHLTKILLTNPTILILDNPFIGLDVEAREQLCELLRVLVQKRPLQLIIQLSKSEHIPDFITNIIEVEKMSYKAKVSIEEYKDSHNVSSRKSINEEISNQISNIPNEHANDEYNEVVKLNNVTIKYGENTILKGLNWSMKRGEKWAIKGRNGSGKSTLLSLISADNPQRYACDIVLFDKGKDSRVSIWDIKKRIGYISPEMHRAYQVSAPCVDIVASGLYDTIGVRSGVKGDKLEVCRFWMRVFGIEDLEKRNFMEVSSGEQRMVLLSRAFVKNPELLILDEPLHGLDSESCDTVRGVIESYCKRKGVSVIFVTHYIEELPKCVNRVLEL